MPATTPASTWARRAGRFSIRATRATPGRSSKPTSRPSFRSKPQWCEAVTGDWTDRNVCPTEARTNTRGRTFLPAHHAFEGENRREVGVGVALSRTGILACLPAAGAAVLNAREMDRQECLSH